jgi:hypothetical protein
MTASDHLGPQFYHSTDAELKPGDVLQPGHPIKNPKRPSSNDFKELGHHNFTWMTTTKPHPNNLGGSYGRNNYQVEPIGLHAPYSFKLGKTGDLQDRDMDEDERLGSSWVSLGGAKVIRKVGDEEPRIGDTK